MGLIDHLGLWSTTATRLHTDMLNAETDPTENERQDAIQLRYIQQIGETRESARQHLESRANEPPSEIRVIAAQPVYSLAPSLIGERPEFRSTVAVELDVFHGRSLEWFTWIDLFRVLVHDTANTPGEKLAVLKRYLRGNCLDVIYGLGGGEPAYMQALTRLKQTCGRVLRIRMDVFVKHGLTKARRVHQRKKHPRNPVGAIASNVERSTD
ncbi:hypothetical protein GHT06_021620 [Daphnia sinensis]|uniref:Uncharacterized protein n=1 Tax=Daphnia sinensis TaxID=1820382 RepID=A0AAD5KJC4_9CRUS|nr:hypothetical protein GHT06_021620 [Daphnia sinensis]